jgi:hypothetical protein
MYRVASLVWTSRTVKPGLWCERCRALQAAKWSLFSGLFGWWGFPWGPIYTLRALYVNGKGGFKPRSENAAMLRVLASQMYSAKNYPESLSALRASIRLESNGRAVALYDKLTRITTPKSSKCGLLWKSAAAAPSLAIILAWYWFVPVVWSQLEHIRVYQRLQQLLQLNTF